MQAHSWLGAGYRVERVDLNAASVTFAPGAPPRPSSPSCEVRSPAGEVILNGVHQIEELLRGVTDQNLHGEWDTGPAAGKEVW